MTWPLLLTGIISLLAAIVLTPMVMVVMTRIGLVDRPDGRRKLHRRTVPLAGGIAVWIAGGLGTLAGNFIFGSAILPDDQRFWICLWLASGMVCLLGIADDAWNLRGRHKVLGQTLACLLVVGGGLVIESIHVFGLDIALGVFAVPFTLFWLLGAINAMNLMDGMDGLAATIGGMIGFALCVMAAMNGHTEEALLTAALVGGIVGFLFYNIPPARIFLGDTGSMVIGLVLGVVAVRASLKGPATIALAAPVTIWTLPILDAAMAIARRRLTGRSILVPDRAHLHHRLSERGFTPRGSLALVVCLTGITTSGALLSMIFSAEWIALVVAAAVIAFLAVTRLFGHSELVLMVQRARLFLQSMVPFVRPERLGREHRSRIQGTTEWDMQWESLLEFAEQCGLSSLQLAVNLPSLHEQFFARWRRDDPPSAEALYHVELPLTSPVLGSIGTVRISGHPEDGSVCLWVSEIVEALRPFELQICDLLTSTGQSYGTKRSFPGALWTGPGVGGEPAEPSSALDLAESPSGAPVAADLRL